MSQSGFSIPDGVSRDEVQVGESHTTYQVKFRHINCRKHHQSANSSGFSPTCESILNWIPNPFSPQARTGDCCGSEDRDIGERSVEAEGHDLEVDLTRVAQGICDNQGVHILRASIVWENGRATTPWGRARMIHNSAVTHGHLALMDQRKRNDYIKVEFVTLHNDEDVRRESALTELTKLSKRASAHCNR
ncbi:hypothetical protein NUW58_g3097 [Xylaria curta]|uniref:Uncharacterized protein n=1 Tax=Xylaria curta TaxID=42375 RepID=A0ACC1PE43_9PEZI|nr:hypothetical protein NUW58_g3097 [Xylaria curta]